MIVKILEEIIQNNRACFYFILLFIIYRVQNSDFNLILFGSGLEAFLLWYTENPGHARIHQSSIFSLLPLALPKSHWL